MENLNKTIEVLEKAMKFTKKQISEELENIDENDIYHISIGIKGTLNLIEVLKSVTSKNRKEVKNEN